MLCSTFRKVHFLIFFENFQNFKNDSKSFHNQFNNIFFDVFDVISAFADAKPVNDIEFHVFRKTITSKNFEVVIVDFIFNFRIYRSTGPSASD